MQLSPQNVQAVLVYLSRAADFVPTTMTETGLMQPVLQALHAVVQGVATIEVNFPQPEQSQEPKEPATPETPKAGE